MIRNQKKEDCTFLCYGLPLSAICSQFSRCCCYCIGFLYSFPLIPLVFISLVYYLMLPKACYKLEFVHVYSSSSWLVLLSSFLDLAFCQSSYLKCVFSPQICISIAFFDPKPPVPCILVSAYFLVSFLFLCLRDLFFSIIM